MTSRRKQKKTAKKSATEAASRKKAPATKKKKAPAPTKTVDGRRKRRLTAEEIGLVNNPDQKIPSVFADPLDTGLPKGRASGFNVISDQTVTLDFEKAREYIDLPVFPGERAAGDAHVTHLLDVYRNNEFNWYSVQLATAYFDGTLWKVNGQHCAWLVLYLDSKFSCRVHETVYRARSAEELGRIYRTYDVGKPRDISHQMKGALVLAEVAPGVPTAKLTRIGNGFRFWKFEASAAHRATVDQQVALAKAEKALFTQVGLFASDAWKESRFMLRKPVLAAMFETFNKVPTIAPEFWYPVATGLNLTTKTDARFKLRVDLEKKYTRSPVGVRSADMKKNMSDEQVYRICIVAWNRWRKGESVQVLKPSKTRFRAA